MCKDMNGLFSEEDIRTAIKYMKIFTTSLAPPGKSKSKLRDTTSYLLGWQ